MSLKRLTKKQELFVEALLSRVDGNVEAAARAAGYAMTGRGYYQLQDHPLIKRELARRRGELAEKTDNLLVDRIVVAKRLLQESLDEGKLGLALKANDQLAKLGGHYRDGRMALPGEGGSRVLVIQEINNHGPESVDIVDIEEDK